MIVEKTATDGDLGSVAGRAPGPELAGELGRLDAATVSTEGLVEMAQAARRLTSWAQSIELGVIAELCRRRTAGDNADWYPLLEDAHPGEAAEFVVDEVAAALNLTGQGAAGLVDMAEQLDQHLPATRAALAEGRIDFWRARVITTGTAFTSDAAARQVEDTVLAGAEHQTTAQLRPRVRRAVANADPAAFERRRAQSQAMRRVELLDNTDGTADLCGRFLPAGPAAAAYNRIGAIAQGLKADGDARPLGQISSDVLLALLRGMPLPEPALSPADRDNTADTNAAHPADGAENMPDNGDEGVAQAIAAAIAGQLSALRGMADNPSSPGGAAPLIHAAIYAMARAVEDLKITWCAQLTETLGIPHPPGRHGHDGYRPPAGMRRMVHDRDRTCRFPTCRRRATQCDLDHTIPHDKNGVTCPCNMAALCRRHHRLKQCPDWELIHLWPGVLIWISPTGHWYIVTPDRRE